MSVAVKAETVDSEKREIWLAATPVTIDGMMILHPTGGPEPHSCGHPTPAIDVTRAPVNFG